MKPMTLEWVGKAEGDFAMVLRESRARKNPSYDGACFHAQQCAEKYLKARLCEAGIDFAKVHDLVALLNQAIAVEPGWQRFLEDLAYLSDFAVAFRYPGESADKATASDARQRCKRFRSAARLSMDLDTKPT
jgi:HEPN domain-containing protein